MSTINTLSTKAHELLSAATVEAGKIKLAVAADLHEFLQIEEHFKDFAAGYVESLKEFHFTGEVAAVEAKLKSLLGIAETKVTAPVKVVESVPAKVKTVISDVKTEVQKVETEIVKIVEEPVKVAETIVSKVEVETKTEVAKVKLDGENVETKVEQVISDIKKDL